MRRQWNQGNGYDTITRRRRQREGRGTGPTGGRHAFRLRVPLPTGERACPEAAWQEHQTPRPWLLMLGLAAAAAAVWRLMR